MTTRPRSLRSTLAAITALALAAVAGPPASAADPAVTTVASLTFEDATTGDWTTSGSPTLDYVAIDGGTALGLTRAADYEGIQSPTGIFTDGVVYTLSMRARLPEGSPVTSTELRFVVKPAYTWVGNATITADGWTELRGEYTVPADVDPTQTQVYLGTADQTIGAYQILVDDISITAPSSGGGGSELSLTFDFEDGLQGWAPRADADGPPVVATTTAEAHGGAQAALVSGRTTQGDGIGYDATAVLEPGTSYDLTAWVKMAEGEVADDLWLSAQRTVEGADSFDTIGQFADVSASGWTQITATYTPSSFDTVLLYLETSYTDGGAGAFLVDDLTIRSQDAPVIEDLTPVKDTVPFPVGIAIDSREATGAAGELLLRHANQVTAENHMKVEAWYDDARTFRLHPEAKAVLDLAQANDLRVYGHVLVWHSQTPAWFFTDDAGVPLTTSPADQQVMRNRLKTHIDNVARTLAEAYGPFGSPTNPLVAWDVVNEVVADGTEYADGLRRSEWYRILGEDFIDLAFTYADEAFNEVYAAAGTDRPVTLFINDYNTEQGGKQDRYHALVSRLLARGVPVDGVGHQMHVSLSTPVSSLDAALTRFADLPVVQAVTELDVTVGSPVTEANLIEQGYYYRDAFRVFRAHAEDLYSVTIWGLQDSRSWRSEQAPLLFTSRLAAKPAYYGAVDGELPARLQSALSFAGSVPVDAGATEDPTWGLLPLTRVEDVAAFSTRWAGDHLTVYLSATDADAESGDSTTLVLGETSYTVARDGTADVPAVVSTTAQGWSAVAHLPLTDAVEGDTLALDVQVSDGASTVAWNSPGVLGTLTLVEPLSVVEVVEAPSAPTVDGVVDEVWAMANAVTTDKQISGSADGAATAAVRTLWSGDGSTLYVLAEVTDDQLDATGSDPWIQDSVELFLDAGNYRNGPYRYDDTQIRINYANVVSFGTGDETFQRNRLTSATATTETGYLVEAAISLLESGGPGTVHGFDVQINDGTAGTRTSVRSWADPTGIGYQNTTRWGVAELVEAPVVLDPQLQVSPGWAAPGRKVLVEVTGYRPGEQVQVVATRVLRGHHRPVVLGTVTTDDAGAASARLRLPTRLGAGVYLVTATQSDLRSTDLLVVWPSRAWPRPHGLPWFC